jgi:streptogramin lyase
MNDSQARASAMSLIILFVFGLGSLPMQAEEVLFVARPLTANNLFTPGIEGPACDRHGNIYAVNFGKEHTIGKVSPDGKAELFIELPEGSTGNGIVFDSGGVMFVADYTGHNVLRTNPATRVISVHAHEPKMNQRVVSFRVDRPGLAWQRWSAH